MPRPAKIALLVFATVLVLLIAAEVTVRVVLRGTALGRVDGRRALLNEPRVFEPDPVLGWRNRPGSHLFRYRVDGRVVQVTLTVDDAGHRHLGLDAPDPDPRAEIAIIGDSITFGWAVGDADPYPARLAQALPGQRFVNLASGGYGTYQALLSLEQRYAAREPPRLVIYGLASFHAERSVATPAWRYQLYQFSERGYVDVPFVSIGKDGALVRHAPEPVFPHLAALRWSRLMTQVLFWREMRAFQRRRTAPAPALALLLRELRDWCTERGSGLIVAYLDEAGRDALLPVLRDLGVTTVPAGPMRPLPYDLHPDAGYHADLARRLEPEVRRLLGE